MRARTARLAAIGEGMVELELERGEEVAHLGAGGDAPNVAAMAALLGVDARIGGRVGADPFGSWLLAFWRRLGIDVNHVRVDHDAPTGLYLNAPAVNGDGHAFTYWRSGSAGSRLTSDDLDDGFFAGVGILVVTGVTMAISRSCAAAARHAIRLARRHGARVAVVLNHRANIGGDTDELAAIAHSADIVIGSTVDADAIFGEADARRLANGPLRGPELVLTAGGDPAVAVVDGCIFEQLVPDVPLVNAAGAGDAFAGAYLATRLQGDSAQRALAWGVAASARSVTRRGCASSYPTAREVAPLVERLLVAR